MGRMELRKSRVILFLTAICLLFIGQSWAQALPEEFPGAQSLFARAQRLMREKDYPGAIDAYQELVKGYRESQYRDIYNYGLARAYYLSGEFDQAYEILASYDILFPNSYLVPYAYNLTANCAYRKGYLETAFRFYIQAYRKSADRQLRSICRRSVLAAVEAGYLPADSVLADLPSDLMCPVKHRLAFLMSGYWSRERVDSLLAGCPTEQVTEEEPLPPPPEKNGARIGVMLPLSGPYAQYGQSVLDGAMLAAETLSHRDFHIQMLVYDTRADHLTAARIANELVKADVDLVIGPLLSSIAATVASILSADQVPLLVPAASQAGITDLSPYCFQMSPNMITIGRGLAQYAARHRGMTTMAVITPASSDEMAIADAFVNEAKALGINVFAYERFRPGETDFGPYIKDIKEAILGPVADSTFYITLDGDTLKPGEMPVVFDGLFIPATEQQLFLLLPQINFYRISTSYLGSQEWNTEDVLKLGEKVLGDAVFYSDKAAMQNSLSYDKFAAGFDAKYGEPPDRLAALGFDAVNLMAAAKQEGHQGPSDISAYLRVLNGYEGASGRITFGAGRSNLELALFAFRDGLVRPLVESPSVVVPDHAAPSDSIQVDVIKHDW